MVRYNNIMGGLKSLSDVFDRVMARQSIIMDSSVFSFDYIPERFCHRDGEMEALATAFRPLFTDMRIVNAMITGGVGTGKTLLAIKFAEECNRYAEKTGLNLRTVHVNCRLKRSEATIVLSILTALQPYFPDRGFSTSEMLEIIKRHIEQNNMHLVIFLDEVDVILRIKGNELVYNLTRMYETIDPQSRATVSVVLISSNLSLISLMDKATRDTFRGNSIYLKPYTSTQLKDIMAERIEKGIRPGAISQEVIDLIADIGELEKSARVCIELLEKGAQRAESAGRHEITPEDIRIAKSRVTIVDNKLWDLDVQRLMVTLAITRTLRNKAYTFTGDCEKAYKIVCEEYGIRPLGHTKFWALMKELDAYGIFAMKKSGQGVGGNTTLVFLPSISARDLEDRTIEILNEKMKGNGR